MREQIRVLLVDDQDLIRTGFRLILLREPDISVAGEAGDGHAALALLAQLDGGCDVVLMDVRMPRMNGIDATRRIVAEHPDVRVLVLTTFDSDEYAQAAVQAGASGFLLKDARPTELVDAIRRVAAGDAVMAPATMRRMLEQMRDGATTLRQAQGSSSQAQGSSGQAQGSPGQAQGSPDQAQGSPDQAQGSPDQAQGSPDQAQGSPDQAQGSPGAVVPGAAAPADPQAAEALVALTDREREVLALIAEGLNNAEISERLYLSESTVKTHVGRVLFKLGLRDRIHAVIFAKEQGL